MAFEEVVVEDICIVNEVLGSRTEEEEESSDEEEVQETTEVVRVTHKEVRDCLATINSYFLRTEKCYEEVWSHIACLEDFCEDNAKACAKQSKITDFFK